MANAAPHLKEMTHALHLHPLADFRMILGVFGCGGRHSMIERDRHTFGMQHFGRANLLEDFADGRGVIVAEINIGFYIQNIPDAGAVHAGCAGEGFFGKGVSDHVSVVSYSYDVASGTASPA